MLEQKTYSAKEVNEIIENIALGATFSSGEGFFEKLVLHLWNLYKTKFILIGTVNPKLESVTTLKFCIDGIISDNISYGLENTPCKTVVEKENCSYAQGVQKAFPKYLFLQEHNIESYVGIRLFDHDGKGIGLIACLDTREIVSPKTMTSIIEIFASRASAELERIQTEKELEERVIKRTQELQNALDMIREQSNERLVESEKMACLGAMVAGFTHDLNTPIGLSITGVSYIQSENRRLSKEIQEGKLSKNSLLDYLHESSKMAETMSKSLDKAKELVRSFKLISIDQHLDDIKTINLRSYLDDIILSLHFKLKHTNIKIINNIPSVLQIKAHAGMFFQIFGNLILNSVKHGFDTGDEGRIDINASYSDDILRIEYSDSGKGMDELTKKHIFDQFYTTKKDEGGTGLGMYILYDLIVKQAGGKVSVSSELGKGSVFNIEIKI